MSRSPPLRFLILLLAGWSGVRAALLAPAWWTSPAGAGARIQGGPAEAAAVRGTKTASHPPDAAAFRPGVGPARMAAAPNALRRRRASHARLAAAAADGASPANLAWRLAPAVPAGARRGFPRPPAPASPSPAAAKRWAVAAWSFLRQGDAAPLAAGGLLGGSQAGGRITYRLNRDRARPLALAARVAAPIRRPAGAEAALGLDWQPSRRVPLHLLAERRQALGREGRSAFGLTVYGGVSEVPLGRFRVDAYAQAGVVGSRSRDLFGDGALRLSLPLGRSVRLGAGAWAAAQPGVARVDLGPQASLRLRLAGRDVTLAADWRQRVAGNARPGSGPALTLVTDF